MEKTKTPSQTDSSQKGEKSSPATLSHRIENAIAQDMPLSILLAESDVNWGRFLHEHLTKRGYTIHWVKDGQAAWQRFSPEMYNFCIVNPELPTMSGLELVGRIRACAAYIPIVFTASAEANTDEMRLACFNAGADDFVSHPCDLNELELRIRAIGKRFRFCPTEHRRRVFDLGLMRFDYDHQCLFNRSQNIRLTTKEAALLYALCLKKGEVLEREHVLLSVWNNPARYNMRSMHVYISKLRNLLSAHTHSEILNVHGVGFKLITHHAAAFRNLTQRQEVRLLRSRREGGNRRVGGCRSSLAPYPTAPSLPFPMFSDLAPDYHTPDYHTPLTDRNDEDDDDMEVLVPVK